MGKLYLDRRYYAKSETRWVSFESNPSLRRTKGDIYGRCVPCITSLYEQLREGSGEIRLGNAYQCWKVVVTLGTMEECTQFLGEFESRFLEDMDIKGRFGSGDPAKDTRIIVFNAEDEAVRDRLYEKARACAGQTHPGSMVSYHRACADLYHALLGDWRQWREVEPIKHPEMAGVIIEKIRKALYWEKGHTPADPGPVR